MDEEMICEKPKKLEDMSYEELLEQQKRKEGLFQTYRDALSDALIEYEGKKIIISKAWRKPQKL